MFVQLEFPITIYAKNNLFLYYSARPRANFIFSNKVLANWAPWFSAGLFCFGHLRDNGANDPCLSLASVEASLRGSQGNDRDHNLFRSQKGWGDIRGSYTTQGLTITFPDWLCLLNK